MSTRAAPRSASDGRMGGYGSAVVVVARVELEAPERQIAERPAGQREGAAVGRSRVVMVAEQLVAPAEPFPDVARRRIDLARLVEEVARPEVVVLTQAKLAA